MSERVEIEVEYRVRAKILLPTGQDYPEFLDSPESWEDALVNDLMCGGNIGHTEEFAPYVKAIRVDTSDSTDDPDWMEL